MKIVITDSTFPGMEPEREAAAAIGARLERHRCVTEEDVVAAGKDADGLFVQFAPVTAKVIERLERCRMIVRYGIGVDNVDVEAARSKGIKVCNVPNYCLDEVADHTAALILNLARTIFPLHQSVMEGKWEVAGAAAPILQPKQAIVGLIGVGRIGERVAERLQAFHYQVHAYDPYLTNDRAVQRNITKRDSLEDVLRAADFLSMHAPLTDETRKMINRDTLGLMKTSAYVINTSRGGLIDTATLAAAIREGRIAGAALDVFETEPLEADHLLRTCGHVILTPHAAYFSNESMKELQRLAAAEMVRAFTGQPLFSWINR